MSAPIDRAAPPLPQVIGENVRRLRAEAGITQAAVAEQMVVLGFAWTGARVAQIEAGLAAPDVRMLLALASVLDFWMPYPRQVTLADLLTHDGSVALTEGLAVPGSAVVGVLKGGRARVLPTAGRLGAEPVPGEPSRRPLTLSKTDQRVAKELRLTAAQMRELTARVWGRSLEAERDARVGEGVTNRVEKARVTAALREELRAVSKV